MRDQKTLLDDLGAVVVVISFESPAALARFHWFRDLPFLVVSNQSRQMYHAFGLRTRAILWLFDRDTIGSYARGLLHGRLPRWPRGDLYQLGGDVVLNRGGEVVFVHRSATPADRPSVDTLVRVLGGDEG